VGHFEYAAIGFFELRWMVLGDSHELALFVGDGRHQDFLSQDERQEPAGAAGTSRFHRWGAIFMDNIEMAGAFTGLAEHIGYLHVKGIHRT
jgi:hypothetical protein